MGDPTGIGPEIIVKALSGEELFRNGRPVILGDPSVLAQAVRMLRLDAAVEVVEEIPEDGYRRGRIIVYPLSRLKAETLSFGKPDRACGKAMAGYVEQAVKWVLSGEIDAITTCPINKQAINEAGYDFPGHTEMLAHLAGVASVAMMFVGSTWKVILVTTHLPLKDVPREITTGRVASIIEMADQGLKQFFGIDQPRIAVLGLNPHCGEEGLLGEEEEREILPAIEETRDRGLSVEGPFPADSFFTSSNHHEQFDAVIAMYHDQGLIPIKMADFKVAVNFTLGLPFIRTSVAHGTAYDIAGRGVADETNLIHATLAACTLAKKAKRALTN